MPSVTTHKFSFKDFISVFSSIEWKMFFLVWFKSLKKCASKFLWENFSLGIWHEPSSVYKSRLSREGIFSSFDPEEVAEVGLERVVVLVRVSLDWVISFFIAGLYLKLCTL